MRKSFLIALVLLVLSPFAINHSPLLADDVVYLTTDQFKARIFDYKTEKDWKYKGTKPCIIDFYTTWCGPCKVLAAKVFPQKEVGDYFNPRFVSLKLDMEKVDEWLANGAQPTDTVARLIDEARKEA